MSRQLVALAALGFAVAALAPIAAMLPRVDAADLAALLDARTLALLGRTLAYGLAVAALASLIGLAFGFLVARTDVPGAGVLRALGVVPLLLPPTIVAMTWTAVAEIRGAPAAYFVSTLGTFPLVAVFAARAFERIDGRLEEAAALVGGRLAVLRADLPLVLPPAACGACFAFAFTINDFSVPDYVSWLGVPKFNVYADEIFATWRIDSDAGRAVATAIPLVLLSVLALVPALALRRRGAMAAFGSGFVRPRRIELGAGRWIAFLFAAGLLALACGVPIARLAWETGGGPRGFSLDSVRAAFAQALDTGRDDLRTSLGCSVAAATIACALALALGHALSRARRGRAFELGAIVPIAVPAILFSIGAIVLWNRDATAALYDGPWMVVLLLVGRFAAFPLLAVAGGVAMLDPALEESAQLAGAGPAARLARIVAPGVRPLLIGAWVLVFALSMRELDATILVPAANHTAMFRVFNALHFGRDAFVAALALLLVFLALLPGALGALFARFRLEVLP